MFALMAICAKHFVLSNVVGINVIIEETLTLITVQSQDHVKINQGLVYIDKQSAILIVHPTAAIMK